MKNKKLITLICAAVMALGIGGVATACGVKDDGGKTTATVRFNVNTQSETNSVKDKTVTIGKRVTQPKAYILEENPDNFQVYGWYTDAACTQRWDFKTDRVQGDLTLYAKWVELYDVNYYVNGEFLKTETAFKGDFIMEDATLVEGYKYLGTYSDASYAEGSEFDFTAPVSGETDVYVKRSPGIYLSDHADEGELASGGLTDYLVAYIGTYTYVDNYAVETEGWVEERTVVTNYEDRGPVMEDCTYVNFGYTPNVGDGFVELSLALDITQSQIIKIYFKNLGNAESMSVYFTALLDPENNLYSETGMNYSDMFHCRPAAEGDFMFSPNFSESQKSMDESDEWLCATFNLYDIYKNGYSIWGTSPYLGSLRIQSTYKCQNENDESNAFLIKAIEGVPYDVALEDGVDVTDAIEKAENTTEKQLQDASAAQSGDIHGLIFPKDNGGVYGVTEHAEVYNSVDGLLFYSLNEVSGREVGSPMTGFKVAAPENRIVDLGEWTTLNVTLRNYGYAEKITVTVYNDQGVPTKTEIEIGTTMLDSKTYSVNLYGKLGMSGNLTYVEFSYNSLGMDNMILLEKIEFTEFVAADTVGINLFDKFYYGFQETSDVKLGFDSKNKGTEFEVLKDGASIETTDKTYKATTDGYAYADLQYRLPRNSSVTAVIVEFKIGGKYTTPYRYELNTESREKNLTATLPFVMNERGFVQGVKFTFEGTGKVVIQGIDYRVGETSLPYYQSYAGVFQGQSDWTAGAYEYDTTIKASVFKNTGAVLSSSIYIGYSRNNVGLGAPHETYNVLVEGKTYVKIVYQNKTNVGFIDVAVRFANGTTAPGDESPYEQVTASGVALDKNMKDYEWSCVTIEIPETHIGEYLSKINFTFLGKEIAIRAISIEKA